jgi:hypothetical protein
LSSAPADVITGFAASGALQIPVPAAEALAGQKARPVSPNNVSDALSIKTGMNRNPRDGAERGARYSNAAEYARIPPSEPAGYPRTPKVRRS